MQHSIEKAKNELEKYSLEKVSLSDPECRMMQSKKKFAELSYNVQLSVSKNQIIVANNVCQDKHDVHQFVPQIKNMKENVIDFRREGKNKIFFLKKNLVSKTYILQAELHKLTKLLRHNPELSIIFEEILKKTDEKLIVLFGSYAKGLAKKDSDMDIYIETLLW